MTEREKIIVSAYTGIMMCEFSKVHKYIEDILGRPVSTHELTHNSVWKEIQEKSKSDFVKICEE